MFAAVLPNLFDQIKKYGAESVEMEFKLGKVTRHRYDAIRRHVAKDTRYRPLNQSHERNEYNGTDARRVHTDDGRSFTLYKKRLLSIPFETGKFDVSLERPGEPSSARYTIFRDKYRESYCANDVWRLDITRIRTNDPQYADCDDELFEVELELILTSEMMLYYTLDFALHMGHELFMNLLQL